MPTQAQGHDASNIPHLAMGKIMNLLYTLHLCVGQGMFSCTRLTCWLGKEIFSILDTCYNPRSAPIYCFREFLLSEISCTQKRVGWALWVLILPQANSCSFSYVWMLWCVIRDVSCCSLSLSSPCCFISWHWRETSVSEISALVSRHWKWPGEMVSGEGAGGKKRGMNRKC